MFRGYNLPGRGKARWWAGSGWLWVHGARCARRAIARLVTGVERGTTADPLQKGKRRFWDTLAYSRVVSWGRELKAVRAYFDKNRFEAIGFRGARLRITPTGRAIVVIGDPRLWALAKEQYRAPP